MNVPVIDARGCDTAISRETLEWANAFAASQRHPDGVVFRPVPLHHPLVGWAYQHELPAVAVVLASSYMQRIVARNIPTGQLLTALHPRDPLHFYDPDIGSGNGMDTLPSLSHSEEARNNRRRLRRLLATCLVIATEVVGRTGHSEPIGGILRALHIQIACEDDLDISRIAAPEDVKAWCLAVLRYRIGPYFLTDAEYPVC